MTGEHPVNLGMMNLFPQLFGERRAQWRHNNHARRFSRLPPRLKKGHLCREGHPLPAAPPMTGLRGRGGMADFRLDGSNPRRAQSDRRGGLSLGQT